MLALQLHKSNKYNFDMQCENHILKFQKKGY